MTVAVPRLKHILVFSVIAASSAVLLLAQPAISADATGAAGVMLPTPLTDSDALRYRRIFDLQERAKWHKADHEIGQLENRLLMGHVQAQRYLHPTSYRSRFKELSDWLKLYNDHPDAKRIHWLAKRRKPRRAKRPPKPAYAAGGRYYDVFEATKDSYRSPRRRSQRQRRRVRAIKRHVRSMVYHRRLTRVEKEITEKKWGRILDPVEMDLVRARIGAGWYYWGNDENAIRLAGGAARRSGRHLPFAHWTAGLAAFRLGRYGDAVYHFEHMAWSDRISGWNLASASFWAARANMLARKPDKVHHWLHESARHARTFYGILARRILGLESPLRWDRPAIDPVRIGNLAEIERVQRALGLIQVGQYSRSERELRELALTDDPETTMTLLAISEAVGLPSLAMRAAKALQARGGEAIDRGLYPVPHWRPVDGFTMDRALLFAFMRQESGFKVRAKSRAGARGLMQLMPGTAGFIAKRRFRGRHRNQLFDPELNISLGQKYLKYLLGHELVGGDMFLLAAAYNAGPGNLAKWHRRVKNVSKDPLLFIESIPARETRLFIERVLANLWIYRERLDQPAPSLDAIAAGDRPVYRSVDGDPARQTADVGN